jgi:magnesium-transporting ATPase (P-type)
MTASSTRQDKHADGGTEPRSWHALGVDDTVAALGTTGNGLGADEAQARIARFGRNTLPGTARRSMFRRLLAQFDNVLIYVLLGAALVTAALGHLIDTLVILLVVVANAAIGFLQEGKAEAALESIRSLISPRSSVLRDGRRHTIDAADVVPGDLLLLESGDRVAADVRLVRARNLRLDESILTGESVPVEKSSEPVDVQATLGDRRSMAFSGTLVTAGQGAGIVVATASASELGRISTLLGRVERLETPLIRKMNSFAHQLTIAILVLAAATLAFAVLVRGYPPAEAFMVVVGMAVAAIPEGLPAVMTITLAIGVQRMAQRNAIIRRLPAVETLGAVSIICSDKTGTLTRNEMTATRLVAGDRSYDIGGVGYAPKGGFSVAGAEIDPAGDKRLQRVAMIALLCNDASLRMVGDAWVVDGDPMEGALAALGMKAGLDPSRLARELPRIDAIPFDAAHRYMATLHHGHDGTSFVCVKGAPERLLEMCARAATADGDTPIDRGFWTDAIDAMARDGRRVLAFARRDFAAPKRELVFGDVDDGLVLEALIGLIDPPRPEAVAAVAECREAGIAVKMITGDHRATAAAIAAELGLERPQAALAGHDLDALDPSEFARAVAETSVFARTSPEHKLALVGTMQAKGDVIAMTGDGVNDAPALKRADVGVAMGRGGTEAAKEAADMVLADDNFASIVAAVREGRTVYDNLTKVIAWTLPTNGGETLIVAAALLLGLTLPITPVQILWINMVTAVGLGLVLAFEPAEADIMRRPPRAADAPILSGFVLWRVALVSVLFALAAFGVFAWAEARGLSDETARTMVVNTVVVMEIFYLFAVRHLHGSSLTLRGVLGTPAVLLGVGSIVLLQLAFTYAPFMQHVFQTRDVGLREGLVILACGVCLLILLEIEKRAVRRWLAFRGA